MIARNPPHHFIRNARPLAQMRQMKLLDFPAAAHVMHQKV
jgi:hypothetical protein